MKSRHNVSKHSEIYTFMNLGMVLSRHYELGIHESRRSELGIHELGIMLLSRNHGI